MGVPDGAATLDPEALFVDQPDCADFLAKTLRPPYSRRVFLGQVAGLSAACLVPARADGAPAELPRVNPDLRFAQIGCGGNGNANLQVSTQFGRLVALCDVDANHLSATRAKFGGVADVYADYRDVLGRDDIDFVTISTPDHWHTKILVEAMRAGKDAYCEKPLTLTIDEGKLIRRVQQETGRVVQVGTQQNSMYRFFPTALALIAEGRIGKIKRIEIGLGAGAWSPAVPTAEVPAGLDWDRWLGPASETPFRFAPHPDGKHPFTNGHRHFRWWHQFSGGKLTDWGAHHVDIGMRAIAAAGQNNDPVSVEGTAQHAVDYVDGKPVQDDVYNTAQKFDLRVKFAGGDVEMVLGSKPRNGLMFRGERSDLFVTRGELSGPAFTEQRRENPLPEDALLKVNRGVPMRFSDRSAHYDNFIQAMEGRFLPISDVHSHMKMLNVCHLAGICCRLGRRVRWDEATQQIIGDDVAAGMMSVPYRDGFAIENAD